MALAPGHELKAVGFSPVGTQLIKLQKFCTEQIASIYSLPPVFLQDLSTGTFSNVEQHEIHYVTQTLRRWIEQTEQGMKLKMSFAFVPTRQSWDDEQEMPVRTIQEAERYDVSIVTTSVYSGTEIGLRSLEHHRKQKRKSQALSRVRMKAHFRR